MSTPVPSSANILLLAGDSEVIGIDEAQFDMELPAVCNQLADSGIRVILAGLDMDFQASLLAQCHIFWLAQNT